MVTTTQLRTGGGGVDPTTIIDVSHVTKTFVSPDELHMNDWSYACVAKLLAAAIAAAATRPIASAAARFGR